LQRGEKQIPRCARDDIGALREKIERLDWLALSRWRAKG